MKILVLTAGYPKNDGTHERMFVHVRNLYYQKKGIDVTVLNFASTDNYVIDGIRVISKKEFVKGEKNYDILVSHASNIRNHYLFLKQYDHLFNKIVFFFHGHEVLKLNSEYPKPYNYMNHMWVLRYPFQNVYDEIKLFIWRHYYKKIACKAYFVFVSNWIKKKFNYYIKLDDQSLANHCYIINNSIGAAFEDNSYDLNAEKKYDYITIRSNIDGAKYGVDIVVKMAQKYPDKSFLLIGKGHYFNYNVKPSNMVWIDRTMNHQEMFKYLDQSKCALLFTREDTQGVMTCELAAYGIPVITSDIEVCHEFFDDMSNVALVNNDCPGDINDISQNLINNLPYKKNTVYFGCNKISEEIELFKTILAGRA